MNRGTAFLAILVACTFGLRPAVARVTENNGLIDDPRFVPAVSDSADPRGLGVKDFDGVSLLPSEMYLGLLGNQISSLANGEFAWPSWMRRLDPYCNQLTCIETKHLLGVVAHHYNTD